VRAARGDRVLCRWSGPGSERLFEAPGIEQAFADPVEVRLRAGAESLGRGLGQRPEAVLQLEHQQRESAQRRQR
jgi:hypothetical protein